MTETPTPTQWFIARDGAQHGPLTDAEIRMFVQGGHMRPTDLVWRPGFPDWQPAPSVFPPPAQQPASTAAQTAPGTAAAASRSHAETAQPRVEPRFSNQAQVSPRPAADKSSPARPGDRAPQRQAAAGGERHQSRDRLQARPQSQERTPAQHYPHAPERSLATSNVPSSIQVEDDYVAEDLPRSRRRFSARSAAIVLVLIGLMAGGGWLVAQNRDALLAMANISTAANEDTPVVKADSETKTALLDEAQPDENSLATETTSFDANVPAPAIAQRPSVTPEMIDENFQRSPLWSRLKADYPDWYQQNVEEAARIVSAGTEADMSRHLIAQLVDLRRKNAEHALAAETGKLINIAQSFLANMKSLASHSENTCYSFIGQGESSPAVIELFPQRGYGEAIEAQIAAIFEAVASGREAPVTRVRATKTDYDVLAAELTKLGWSKADLRVFADPKALAETEPGKVCQMVQDWFTAHLAITDPAVQERLLFETLRPIVAG